MNTYCCTTCKNPLHAKKCMIRDQNEQIFSEIALTNESIRNFIDRNSKYLHWDCTNTSCYSKDVVFECTSSSHIIGKNFNLTLSNESKTVYVPGTFCPKEDCFYFNLVGKKYYVHVKSEKKPIAHDGYLIASKVYCLYCFSIQFGINQLVQMEIP